MSFFITEDVTVLLHEVRALSRSGSDLKIHLVDGEIITSKVDRFHAEGWQLENYTSLWKAALAEEANRFRANLGSAYQDSCTGSAEVINTKTTTAEALAKTNEPPTTSQTQIQN